jgi:hypothetical protein
MADVEEEHNSWLDTLISSFSKSDKDENKPLSISNVPLFSRPMEATDSDIPVGQDELGNVTYMTMLGDKYTVSPAPDQRTTMAKVKEDVIPAVKAYAKNPTLPTGQQVLDTGKAVAVGAYDAMSIPKKLLTSEMGASEVTVGDVLDTTGSMALGSTFAKVPQGALRTFGGSVDKDAPIGRATTVAKPSRPSSAYYPIKDAPDAKVDLWKAAAWGDAAPEGLENITTNQLKEYKNLLANPEMENGQVAAWLEEKFPTAFKVDSSGKMNDIGEENWASLDELSSIADTKQMADVMNTGSVLAYYRSPVVEIVEAIDYPRDGIKGSNLLKIFRDNPDIRNSEIEGMGLDIDQAKRYTKEEVSKLVDNNVFDVTVENIAGTGTHVDYSNTQRQKDIFDPKAVRSGQIKEIDYAELIVNSTRKDNTLPTHMPKEGDTHFGINNLAHARASIIEDAKGTRSVLVEELQSDLTQQGWDAPVNIKTIDEFVKYKAKESIKEISEYIKKLNASGFPIKDLTPEQKDKLDKFYEYNYERGKLDKNLDWRNDWIAHQTATNKLIEKYNLPPLTNADGVVVGLDREAFTTSLGLKDNGIELGGTWSIHDIVHGTARAIQLEPGRVVNNFPDRVGAPPVKTNYETTKLSMQATLAYAARNGVGEIVIPNLERIVERRFDLGSSGYTKALDKNSGFTQTYVLSLNRYIKELQAQYPDDVKISERVLPYRKRITLSGKEIEGNNTAMVIDISGLLRKNIDLTKPRFAKGGVVTNTEKQMNNLFAEGGIKDDGMNVDPVSGNEVPSGSMASEVRDDIDAKLSEGEYVVPADVVRYFGVAFFEKLRNKAKEGLSGMESDGRIGGEPVEDDSLPFDVSELQSIDEGGTDAQMQDLGMAEGGIVGYAPGGDVVPMPTIGNGYSAGFSPRNFPIGFSVFGNRGAASTEPVATSTKTYTNAAGDTITIRFDANGNPMDAIPEGYFLVGSQGAIDALQTSPTDTFDRSNDDPEYDPDLSRSREFGLDRYETTSGEQAFQDIVTTSKYNADGSEKTALQMQREMGEANVGVLASYDDPKTWMNAIDGAIKNMNEARITGKVASTVGGVVLGPIGAVLGGAVGIVGQATEIAKMRALVKAGEDWGSLNPEQAAQAYKSIDEAIANASPAVQKLVADGTGVATGNKFYMETMRQIEAQHAMGVTTDLSNSRYELWDTLTSVNSNTDEAMAAREKVNNEEKARIEEEERVEAQKIAAKALADKAIKDKAIADQVANDKALAEQKRIQMERETAARQQAERDAFAKEQAARDKAEAQAELEHVVKHKQNLMHVVKPKKRHVRKLHQMPQKHLVKLQHVKLQMKQELKHNVKLHQHKLQQPQQHKQHGMPQQHKQHGMPQITITTIMIIVTEIEL